MPALGAITRMAVLGLLHTRGPAHGYEIKRRAIDEGNMQWWAKVEPATIYTSIRQLLKEGLVEPLGTGREGKRPLRTVYGVTDAGRAALVELLRAAWADRSSGARQVDMALSFAYVLEPSEIEGQLVSRLEGLRASLPSLELHRARVPRLFTGFNAIIDDLFEHVTMTLRTEIEWTERVLQNVRDRVYFQGPEPNTETSG